MSISDPLINTWSHAWSEEVKAMAEMKGECTKELCGSRDALAEPFLLLFFVYEASISTLFAANVFLSYYKVTML